MAVYDVSNEESLEQVVHISEIVQSVKSILCFPLFSLYFSCLSSFLLTSLEIEDVNLIIVGYPSII